MTLLKNINLLNVIYVNKFFLKKKLKFHLCVAGFKFGSFETRFQLAYELLEHEKIFVHAGFFVALKNKQKYLLKNIHSINAVSP